VSDVTEPAAQERVGLTLNLHTHLEGWLRPQTAAELGADVDIEAPAAEWAEAMRVSVPGDLSAYLERVAVAYPLLRSAAALERVTSEAVEDAAVDGCRFLELRVGPVTHASDALPLEGVMEALCRGLQRGIEATGIAAGLVPAVLRHHEPSANERLAELAVRHRGDGVVGFDIAGDELVFPDLDPHIRAFEIARAGGLGITAHAAEAGPASAAKEAYDLLGATRIGHGTRLAQDVDLLAWAADTGICIEVCPTSNYLTGALGPGDTHPARSFLGAGCEVVLGDDNPSQTGSPLSAEAEGLVTRQGLTPEELDAMSAAAMAHAFCDSDTRERLRAIAADQGGSGADMRTGGRP
jgi:adenosine deaminase